MSRGEKYCIWAVTGRKPERKPRRRSTGRGPARDWKYRAWIRTLPCAACGSHHQVEAAHTGSDGGMRQKSSDYSCIPLCIECHTMGRHAYHSASGPAGLEQAYEFSIAATVRTLNHTWFAHASEVK